MKINYTSFTVQMNGASERVLGQLNAELEILARRYDCEILTSPEGSRVLRDGGEFEVSDPVVHVTLEILDPEGKQETKEIEITGTDPADHVEIFARALRGVNIYVECVEESADVDDWKNWFESKIETLGKKKFAYQCEDSPDYYLTIK